MKPNKSKRIVRWGRLCRYCNKRFEIFKEVYESAGTRRICDKCKIKNNKARNRARILKYHAGSQENAFKPHIRARLEALSRIGELKNFSRSIGINTV